MADRLQSLKNHFSASSVTKGSCMCGSINYEFKGEPNATALCHCVDCHKWTGGAYTSNVIVNRWNFKVTKGTPFTYDAKGASGKINRHFFCGNCGSGLYAELEIMPDVTIIKSGGLDGGAKDHAIGVEFYCKDRLSYVKPVDGATQEKAFGG
ncbi:uncharacterized protein BKCO1_510009 [Diplodia corticola]|uniref:CENP-V/GFA domain-containing protein n=1 Tax=Diplodia corticola TaxID=236234 RepID=A0A1J9RTP3_9PEZI|nr:uncharacterized protein BKCO1_510009 [Diplodia corticola]OJD31236.1 hypothetical protein BKCO1_510009 [Diplodia corticola]